MSDPQVRKVLDLLEAGSLIVRLRAEKNELWTALMHLLAKPKCPRCRKAAQAVVDRIKYEGEINV